ncbi:MAG: carbamoyltransferase [Deltaproteobacteria bacterium]|jgi:carbamoyltransferase|nr:carbamoyltransferase [Deltaproteobacteria bacterium]
MLTLGLIDSKPSSVALVDDGRIVAAVAEERLCRMKMAGGMPVAAMDEVLRIAGANPSDVDRVAVAQVVSVFEPEPIAWKGWFDTTINTRSSLLDRLGSSLAPIAGSNPAALRAQQTLKRWLFRDRHKRIPALLRERWGINAPVSFFDHHLAHAASAYYTGGFERALVVTLDGGGDGLSGSVWEGIGGRLRRLDSVPSFHSLGNFYSYVTELCGFKAERHEGKVTGLAARGQPIYADRLREVICYEEPGKIRYLVPMYHRSALRVLKSRLPRDFDRANLAASAQLVLEEIGIAFVRHWLRSTGMTNLCLAGGVFSNVRLNQGLFEIPEVNQIFVHPAMDDSGLAVGAALQSHAKQSGGRLAPARLPNAYLGSEFSDAEITAALTAADLMPAREDRIQEAISERLAAGAVVARFQGRMEYGPRALGNRSVLYQPTDPSVNDWLNERLGRTEFMPFAPATLQEEADDCYEQLEGARDAARFMTITLDCTAKMRDACPGVVHVDGTARPQLVDAETSPDFYAILTAYHAHTGLPALINTSFNLHEEPIVCTPSDAIRAFLQGRIDYLAIGDHLIPHPAIETEGPGARS